MTGDAWMGGAVPEGCRRMPCGLADHSNPLQSAASQNTRGHNCARALSLCVSRPTLLETEAVLQAECLRSVVRTLFLAERPIRPGDGACPDGHGEASSKRATGQQTDVEPMTALLGSEGLPREVPHDSWRVGGAGRAGSRDLNRTAPAIVKRVWLAEGPGLCDE